MCEHHARTPGQKLQWRHPLDWFTPLIHCLSQEYFLNRSPGCQKHPVGKKNGHSKAAQTWLSNGERKQRKPRQKQMQKQQRQDMNLNGSNCMRGGVADDSHLSCHPGVELSEGNAFPIHHQQTGDQPKTLLVLIQATMERCVNGHRRLPRVQQTDLINRRSFHGHGARPWSALIPHFSHESGIPEVPNHAPHPGVGRQVPAITSRHVRSSIHNRTRKITQPVCMRHNVTVNKRQNFHILVQSPDRLNQ